MNEVPTINQDKYVHVIIYIDGDRTVNVDVFSTFSEAYDCFIASLRESFDIDRFNYITVDVSVLEKNLHYKTATGYEVVYRKERIQERKSCVKGA